MMQIAFAPIPKELVTKVESYDYREPLSKVLNDINKSGAVIVTKEGKYYGIADERTLSSRHTMKLDPDNQVGKIARITPILNKDSDIESAIINFYNTSAKALPYSADGNRVSGVVKRTDMLKAMLSLNLLSSSRVRNAMSTPVIAIDHNATVSQALTAMKEHKVYRLVVVENGKLFGILTYKDIARYGMVSSGRMPKFTAMTGMPNFSNSDKVNDIAERNVQSVEEEHGMNDAIRGFVKNNISSLLVVKSGKPVGVITVRDVLELFVKNASQRRSRVLLSGLDEDTREYEDDVITALDTLADRISKFKKMDVDYISLNIKKVKSKEYELKARVGFVKHGTMSMSITGYTLDNTLKELTDRLYNSVERKKDIILTNREGQERQYKYNSE